jgi:hypothetical protein
MKKPSLVSVLALCSLAGIARAAETKRPNIILFLVDDMGWMDCGAYGSTSYEAPQMDCGPETCEKGGVS